jgi:hypothetical protein
VPLFEGDGPGQRNLRNRIACDPSGMVLNCDKMQSSSAHS